MEADISIWRKTGHFYFALTAGGRQPAGDTESAATQKQITTGDQQNV
jgi:hypothetical protein